MTKTVTVTVVDWEEVGGNSVIAGNNRKSNGLGTGRVVQRVFISLFFFLKKIVLAFYVTFCNIDLFHIYFFLAIKRVIFHTFSKSRGMDKIMYQENVSKFYRTPWNWELFIFDVSQK